MMNRLATFAVAAALFVGPAIGQEHATHKGATAAPALPPICLVNAGDTAQTEATPHTMPGSDEAHVALMAGMDKMNADMMAGATATDLDVAFVCGMIPHHQGAIDMAKAELEHGDDPWARDMAEKIIAAQEQEIADMLAWLSTQPN